jgi:hypothetical protein
MDFRVCEPGGRLDLSEVRPPVFSAFNFLEKQGECRYTAPAGHPFGAPPNVFDCIVGRGPVNVFLWAEGVSSSDVAQVESCLLSRAPRMTSFAVNLDSKAVRFTEVKNLCSWMKSGAVRGLKG